MFGREGPNGGSRCLGLANGARLLVLFLCRCSCSSPSVAKLSIDVLIVSCKPHRHHGCPHRVWHTMYLVMGVVVAVHHGVEALRQPHD